MIAMKPLGLVPSVVIDPAVRGGGSGDAAAVPLRPQIKRRWRQRSREDQTAAPEVRPVREGGGGGDQASASADVGILLPLDSAVGDRSRSLQEETPSSSLCDSMTFNDTRDWCDCTDTESFTGLGTFVLRCDWSGYGNGEGGIYDYYGNFVLSTETTLEEGYGGGTRTLLYCKDMRLAAASAGGKVSEGGDLVKACYGQTYRYDAEKRKGVLDSCKVIVDGNDCDCRLVACFNQRTEIEEEGLAFDCSTFGGGTGAEKEEVLSNFVENGCENLGLDWDVKLIENESGDNVFGSGAVEALPPNWPDDAVLLQELETIEREHHLGRWGGRGRGGADGINIVTYQLDLWAILVSGVAVMLGCVCGVTGGVIFRKKRKDMVSVPPLSEFNGGDDDHDNNHPALLRYKWEEEENDEEEAGHMFPESSDPQDRGI